MRAAPKSLQPKDGGGDADERQFRRQREVSMSVNALPVSTQNLSPHDAAIPGAGTPSFEERWAAWLARGAAHDRRVRRRMMLAAPMLAIVAAVLYVLLLR